MSDTGPIRLEQYVGDVFEAMQGVHRLIGRHGLERGLLDLIHLRASQINRCAHCVKMHSREAREHGESNDRLDRLTVWEHVSDFSEREKAAFAWTEALTRLELKVDLGALRARLRQHFSEAEIAGLTAEIAGINFWNRLGVARN